MLAAFALSTKPSPLFHSSSKGVAPIRNFNFKNFSSDKNLQYSSRCRSIKVVCSFSINNSVICIGSPFTTGTVTGSSDGKLKDDGRVLDDASDGGGDNGGAGDGNGGGDSSGGGGGGGDGGDSEEDKEFGRILKFGNSQGVFYGLFGLACGVISQSHANPIMPAKRVFLSVSSNTSVAMAPSFRNSGALHASSAGFRLALGGQGIADLRMTPKWSIKKSEQDIPFLPRLQSEALAELRGFLPVSSNTPCVTNGVERLVGASPVVKKVLPVVMAFTFGVLLARRIYGGKE
ncbi:unnamed protein product [Dovyalis caffra]|uniref:Uncharacterized protein n=1 Tax=Dovyalis caffra TaxID=77055 RepID=A0AAV1RAA5_9ROSI|nr:unnamed protein product [Dovyalis caffra]